MAESKPKVDPLAEPFRIFYAKSDESTTIDMANWSVESVRYILAYGLTQQADAASSVPTSHIVDGRRVAMDGEDLAKARTAAAKAINARLNDLREGKVPTGGGGGAPLTDLVRATRQVTKDFLVANGWKVGAADKAVTKDAAAAFAELVKAKLLEKAAKDDKVAVDKESIAKATAANWAKHIVPAAQTLADAWAKARSATGELEL